MPKLKEKDLTKHDSHTAAECEKTPFFKNPHFYCLAAITLLFFVCAVCDLLVGISVRQRIIVTLILLAALYAVGITSGCDEGRMRKIYLAMTVCYAYFVISSTLFDSSLGRGDLGSIAEVVQRREHYNRWFVNLTPFYTVKTLYIDALKEGYVTLGYVIFNALGNLLLLAPLSVLIPASSKKLGAPYAVLPILLGSTLAIEGLQYLLMRGSCDVDDVIFNFLGALVTFGLFSIPCVSRLAKKIMFNNQN